MPAFQSSKKVKKHINLLPREDFDRTTLGRILKWSLTTFRYIVIFVELIVVAGFLSRFYFDVRISDLNDEIKQQAAVVSNRQADEMEFRKAQLKLSVLSTISDDSNSIQPIIQKVASNMPRATRLNSLTKEGNQISLHASALADSSINDLVNLLISDPAFQNVRLSNIEQDENSVLFQFRIVADINFDNLN